jgi:hypothetical protein
MTIASSFKLIIPLVIRQFFLLFFAAVARFLSGVSSLLCRQYLFDSIHFPSLYVHPFNRVDGFLLSIRGGSSPNSCLTNSATVQDWTHHGKKQKITLIYTFLSGRHHSVGFPSLFVIDRSRICQTVYIEIQATVLAYTWRNIYANKEIQSYLILYIASNALRNWMKRFGHI